jgi:hypothetical protein
LPGSVAAGEPGGWPNPFDVEYIIGLAIDEPVVAGYLHARGGALPSDFTRFTVSTLGTDLPAQKLYEKLGYTRYAETMHYLAGDARTR